MRLLFLILLLPIASCSTYMENKIGQEFKSIQPDFTNVMQEDRSLEGAVYNGRGGLFASDVSANNVGDIITVKMEESMTAANSGSETTTKKDSYSFDLPEALFGDRTVQDYPLDYNYQNEQHRFEEAGKLWKQAAEPFSDHWNNVMNDAFISLIYNMLLYGN